MASFMVPGRDDGGLLWCGGAELRLFFTGGLAALERCALAVDKLNVFPVPDGDTGTNLYLTVLAAAEEVAALPPAAETAEVWRAVAQGALVGARG
ncbi:MAG: DAK2 domain-containing protein, partial [Thermoanaerobaculia bacterium]